MNNQNAIVEFKDFNRSRKIRMGEGGFCLTHKKRPEWQIKVFASTTFTGRKFFTVAMIESREVLETFSLEGNATFATFAENVKDSLHRLQYHLM